MSPCVEYDVAGVDDSDVLWSARDVVSGGDVVLSTKAKKSIVVNARRSIHAFTQKTDTRLLFV